MNAYVHFQHYMLPIILPDVKLECVNHSIIPLVQDKSSKRHQENNQVHLLTQLKNQTNGTKYADYSLKS